MVMDSEIRDGMTVIAVLHREGAVRRSIWLIGAFTLLTQNLFSWYMLWLLPLLALFLKPGCLLGVRADAWTGWRLFCGLVALSYTFFIGWRPVLSALLAQAVSASSAQPVPPLRGESQCPMVAALRVSGAGRAILAGMAGGASATGWPRG